VDTPGYTGAQIFVGRRSLVSDAYGFCSVSEFPNTLSDNIRERGAMDVLISNHANYEMSARVKDMLRGLMIVSSKWFIRGSTKGAPQQQLN